MSAITPSSAGGGGDGYRSSSVPASSPRVRGGAVVNQMKVAEGGGFEYGSPPGMNSYTSSGSNSPTERGSLPIDGVEPLVNTFTAAGASVNGRAVWRPSSLCGSANKRQVALITATVIVDALAPLLQEKATRRRGFEGSSMVLAETMSYFLGGLTLAVVSGGSSGFWRCVRPTRYLAFLPASAAFSTSNFLTYVAVRGLGASQFYLLAQLRVAVLAVFLRIWTGAKQPSLAWLGLIQLAVGMVVLVYFKANVAATDCSLGAAGGVSADWTSAALMAKNTTMVGLRGGGAAARLAAKAAASRAQFVSAMLALAGVIFSSAFAFIYMEWQLKTHASDPLFVQLHQMNSFGAVVSLVIHFGHRARASIDSTNSQAFAAGAQIFNASLANATGLADRASELAQEGSPFPQFLMLITVVISRGVLSGSVLKNLDSIAKGLIDVTAIVVCTGIQFTIDPDSADGTVVGIQALMLLSILSYIIARNGTPSSSIVPQKQALEMSEPDAPAKAK